ncbi:glycosyltransferase family 4 protein [uncultured Sunxiuqinia sp.]|uniref:glycosyltransferase family 4 protein n=1 Tax=uncultured Sunxiuqinia sp. TaxID=1573825 RepID=UPI0026092125|nr:glycosyltransferase family 4 protein [uncultured Sunxiuqinia sp.]
MNILFLTLSRIQSLEDRGIYTDLMRYFRKQGHAVFIVSPVERRFQEKSSLHVEEGLQILRVKTLNIQKTNVLEKGLGTLLIERQYQKAIQKYLPEKMDLVMYSTPPITFGKVIRYIQNRDQAKSYLLLKDIFPQNAVDLSMMKAGGLIHRFFQRKEKELYRLSDFIGCMSPANVAFLLKHHPEIPAAKVEVCPNSLELVHSAEKERDRQAICEKFGIPGESTLFIYGGNLGKPQGLDFLLQVIKSNQQKNDRFFIIIGSGTEFPKMQKWFKDNNPGNALLLKGLPKKEYDLLVGACDVGMIFLDPRFTIPNYPSRLLSYLENKMPVLAATDHNTDIGKMAADNNYGFWSVSGELEQFNSQLEQLATDKGLIRRMGNNGYQFLLENYTVDKSYQIIMNHFK